ncbi:hypothetical protein [Aeromonas hydrophila]|uniref:hypothetical protein n=1 Tax=Aeromonas hydrophila TaxID=644 RepID=UPI00235EEE3F|nr:hypothetical protein [Aeromonas hydrophila]
MRLNEQVNAQISILTERVEKLKTTIRRVDYMLAAAGVTVLAAYLFPHALSLDISSLDIPSTLLDTGDSPVIQTSSVLSSLFGFISTVGPTMGLVAVATGAYFFFSDRESSSGVQTMLAGVVLTFCPYIAKGLLPDGSTEPKYINNAVISSIINFNEAEPISIDFLSKVSRVDERYLLAQAAILSKASYPNHYFKALAEDLSKGVAFKPTGEAMYSIEMAAYGHPNSKAIIEKVDSLRIYKNVASSVSSVAQIMFVMLFLGGAGLKLLRMSINKRLKAILQLVTESHDNAETV